MGSLARIGGTASGVPRPVGTECLRPDAEPAETAEAPGAFDESGLVENSH